jgi:hypothetical protein
MRKRQLAAPQAQHPALALQSSFAAGSAQAVAFERQRRQKCPIAKAKTDFRTPKRLRHPCAEARLRSDKKSRGCRSGAGKLPLPTDHADNTDLDPSVMHLSASICLICGQYSLVAGGGNSEIPSRLLAAVKSSAAERCRKRSSTLACQSASEGEIV